MANNDNELLTYVWGHYREYAATSRRIKSNITKFRSRVIRLTICGAISGTISMQLSAIEPEWIFKLFGGLSAVCIGIAAYFGKEIINPEREKKWVVARSAAEALKSESYLYATATFPYNNSGAANTFLEKSKNIRENTEDIHLINLSDEEKKKRLIKKPFSVDEYIEKRVKEQINEFYRPSAGRNSKILNRWSNRKHLFGIIGIILGAIGGFGLSKLIAGWVAVIATITTAITAYLFAERFSYLSLSYQKTAQILGDHLAEWNISDKSDKAISDLIVSCENTISLENKTWMVELGKIKSITSGSQENKDERLKSKNE